MAGGKSLIITCLCAWSTTNNYQPGDVTDDNAPPHVEIARATQAAISTQYRQQQRQRLRLGRRACREIDATKEGSARRRH